MTNNARLKAGDVLVTGDPMAFKRDGSGRLAVSFIGEGGSSLGEWHEAINLSAARRLPMIFCVQNNQTALSTPVADQSAARVFAEFDVAPHAGACDAVLIRRNAGRHAGRRIRAAHDVDHTRQRVGAVQHGTWTAHDLDALYIT